MHPFSHSLAYSAFSVRWPVHCLVPSWCEQLQECLWYEAASPVWVISLYLGIMYQSSWNKTCFIWKGVWYASALSKTKGNVRLLASFKSSMCEVSTRMCSATISEHGTEGSKGVLWEWLHDWQAAEECRSTSGPVKNTKKPDSFSGVPTYSRKLEPSSSWVKCYFNSRKNYSRPEMRGE